MKRKDITKNLSELTEKMLNVTDPRIYWAKEVTFDYATAHATRMDYMVFKPINNTVSGIEKGDFYCYEIKSCVEDFKSGHGLNFFGDYNYIVCPDSLYEEIERKLPYYVGIYVEHGGILQCIKKAKRADRTRPISEMLLMMFRSCNRENVKAKRFDDELWPTSIKDPMVSSFVPSDPGCPKCNTILLYYDNPDKQTQYCPKCGQKVKIIDRK